MLSQHFTFTYYAIDYLARARHTIGPSGSFLDHSRPSRLIVLQYAQISKMFRKLDASEYLPKRGVGAKIAVIHVVEGYMVPGDQLT